MIGAPIASGRGQDPASISFLGRKIFPAAPDRELTDLVCQTAKHGNIRGLKRFPIGPGL